MKSLALLAVLAMSWLLPIEAADACRWRDREECRCHCERGCCERPCWPGPLRELLRERFGCRDNCREVAEAKTEVDDESTTDCELIADETTPEVADDAVEPEPTPVVPTAAAELHKWIADKLGGYCRPDHSRGEVDVDVYQARGKQRIVWEVVEDPTCWIDDLATVFVKKDAAGAAAAGLVIAPGIVDDAKLTTVCRAAGLWLVVIDAGGNIERRIYPK